MLIPTPDSFILLSQIEKISGEKTQTKRKPVLVVTQEIIQQSHFWRIFLQMCTKLQSTACYVVFVTSGGPAKETKPRKTRH